MNKMAKGDKHLEHREKFFCVCFTLLQKGNVWHSWNLTNLHKVCCYHMVGNFGGKIFWLKICPLVEFTLAVKLVLALMIFITKWKFNWAVS